jgi:hypothetical protein
MENSNVKIERRVFVPRKQRSFLRECELPAKPKTNEPFAWSIPQSETRKPVFPDSERRQTKIGRLFLIWEYPPRHFVTAIT